MRIIPFKSDDEFYWKEKTGCKANTIRKVEEGDARLAQLLDCIETGRDYFVQITHSKDKSETFLRKITDVSLWNGFFIISWGQQ